MMQCRVPSSTPLRHGRLRKNGAQKLCCGQSYAVARRSLRAHAKAMPWPTSSAQEQRRVLQRTAQQCGLVARRANACAVPGRLRTRYKSEARRSRGVASWPTARKAVAGQQFNASNSKSQKEHDAQALPLGHGRPTARKSSSAMAGRRRAKAAPWPADGAQKQRCGQSCCSAQRGNERH